MDMSIGKLRGYETTHTAQKSKSKKMPKSYEDVFFSIPDAQASNRAYMEATEGKNPLNKRDVVAFKKEKYPYGGKSIFGPATNIPLNRIG